MRFRTRGRLVAALPAVIAIAIGAIAARPSHAHELGALKVTAYFAADRSYTIDMQIDAEHLPPGTSPFPTLAESAAGALSPADRQSRMDRFRGTFLSGVALGFDGSPSAPADAACAPVPNATKVSCTMTGTVPRGAMSFTFTETMPLGFYLLRVRNEGEADTSNQWLNAGKPSRSFPLKHVSPPPTVEEVFVQYLGLGFTHIVPNGPDHILFVLGIFFLTFERKPILLQVTSFTVAHSITLGLAIYGVVSLSPRIVEPMIALSIVYVAVENLLLHRFTPWRIAVVFGFGLLHGMGFAGVLRDLGLPRSQFIPALVSFNLGVEAGQLTVITAAFLLVGYWFGRKPWYRRYITVPASVAIALIGAYWAIQRIFFM